MALRGLFANIYVDAQKRPVCSERKQICTGKKRQKSSWPWEYMEQWPWLWHFSLLLIEGSKRDLNPLDSLRVIQLLLTDALFGLTSQGINLSLLASLPSFPSFLPPFLFIEVKLTYIIHHFKVKNSVALRTFAILCNHHLYLVPKHFHHSKRKQCSPHFPPPPSLW